MVLQVRGLWKDDGAVLHDGRAATASGKGMVEVKPEKGADGSCWLVQVVRSKGKSTVMCRGCFLECTATNESTDGAMRRLPCSWKLADYAWDAGDDNG